jgi:methylated-DNA-protein-cysteine methyltransferase-like protein
MVAQPMLAGSSAGPASRSPRSPFARVQALVQQIPAGRVATYGQLSRLIGGRLTPVGVGWALRAAAGLPWHRVVNSRGTLSTERAQPGLQRSMLEAEGVRFDAAGQLDLAVHQWAPRVRAAPAPRRRAGR